MTGASITLQNTQITSDEFERLTIFDTTALYGSGFVSLADLMNYPDSDNIIIRASKETAMTCEVDKLKDQIKIELAKSRKLLKRRFPIRYRLNLLKIFLRYPFSTIATYILKLRHAY